MRVFVLGTGRCGTTTFARAVESAVTNYTAGHESRVHAVGEERFDYPDAHVEVDNRLAWFLAQVGARFDGEHTVYVHLLRDPEAVAASFERRLRPRPVERRVRWAEKGRAPVGIAHAFGHGILMRKRLDEVDHPAIARFMVETITANINAFLAAQPNRFELWIDAVDPAVVDGLWATARFEGDRDRFLAALGEVHNASS